MQFTIAKDTESLHGALLELGGARVALVPTMGALHAGHASLIQRARQEADIVVVSIFVNPTQFGPNEDFDRYPRTLDADCEVAKEAGATIVYAPAADDMYPEGFSTSITAGPMSTQLCGAFRPGHFDGVATVVTKLFLRVMPHVALFGKKDFQQLAIIKQVVRDLDIATNIIGVPTFREKDGLALSSRNKYLSVQERIMAPKIYEILKQTATLLKRTSISDALAEGVVALNASGYNVDYLEFVDSDTLAPIRTIEEMNGEGRLLVAAWLGDTRLIDNIAVS